MFTIVFGTDGSADSRGAAGFLAPLPLPAGSAIYVLSVIYEWTVPPAAFPDAPLIQLTQIRQEEESRAAAAVREAAEILTRERVLVATETPVGEPAHELLLAAERHHANLIAVGSKGLTGLDRFILGSVAGNVAHHAKCPVLVAHAPKNGLKTAIVAIDESEHARNAAEFAARMPLPLETTCVAVNVVRPYRPHHAADPEDPDAFQREVEEARSHRWAAGERIAARGQEPLAAVGRPVEIAVTEGDPTDQILAVAAQRGADLIIAGARGVSLIQGLLVGSVADRLLKQADRSVLLVR